MGFYGGEKSERNLELMFFKSKSSFPWQESTVRCRVHKKKKKEEKILMSKFFGKENRENFFCFLIARFLFCLREFPLQEKY